jgi:hypothetical protein
VDALTEAAQARRDGLKGIVLRSVPKPPSEPRRPPRSPDRAASIARRRSIAASGAVPSRIASNFTTGECAVLSVVAREVQRRGRCELHIDAIAGMAGVARTTAQNALRQARSLGLIAVTERRRAGQRSDTNIIEVVSGEWSSWLKLKGGRVQKAEHHEYKQYQKPCHWHPSRSSRHLLIGHREGG